MSFLFVAVLRKKSEGSYSFHSIEFSALSIFWTKLMLFSSGGLQKGHIRFTTPKETNFKEDT
jgi:hypothetical protein